MKYFHSDKEVFGIIEKKRENKGIFDENYVSKLAKIEVFT